MHRLLALPAIALAPGRLWRTCAALGSSCGLALLVLAAAALPRLAGAADAPASAGPLVPGRSYVVMPGDTLDRVVNKTLTGSPLKNEVLREALVAANAQVLPAGKNPRLVPGTVLQLPDPDAVLRSLASPMSAAAEASAAPGPGDSRRRWVRFP